MRSTIFSAPIVACGICLHFLSTAPSMTCLAYCALLELFLLYMLSCYLYMVGELSPGINIDSGIIGDGNDAADDDNENLIWKVSEACMEGHLDCGD